MVFNVEDMLARRKYDYSWGGAYSYPTDANVVGSMIEQIEERDGAATSGAFLDASRPKESPTHDLFEWDDRKAAEKWRLDTARKIICCLKVTVVDEDGGNPTKVSAFIHINDTRPGASAEYANVVTALGDEANRKRILRRMMEDMRTFASRYRMYEEAASVISAIDAALEAGE